MKQNNLLKSSMVILLMFFAFMSSWAQQNIPAGTDGTVTVNFNGWNGNLPSGFAASGSGNAYRGTSEGTQGGTYAISTKGYGFQPSSSNGVLTLVGTFRNNTGATITSLEISYDAFRIIERASRVPGWAVSSSLSGIGTSLDWLSNQADANKTVTLTGLNVASNATFTLTFNAGRGDGGGSSSMIGLNNVKVVNKSITAAPCATPSGSIVEDMLEATVGQTANFTVSNPANHTAVQWQRSIDGGSTYANISGATSLSYTTESTTIDMDGYMYRAVLTNVATGCTPATLTTNEAMLFVSESTEPTLSVSANVINNLGYEFGSTSSLVQTFTLSGANLTTETVSLEFLDFTGFEFSLDGQNYVDNLLEIAPVNGELNSTVYARLKSGLSIGNYTDNILIYGGGVSTDFVEVTLNGAVTAPVLVVPVATPATEITESTFTANWNQVLAAESYELQVYQVQGGAVTEVVSEDFNWSAGVGGNDGSWSGINPSNADLVTSLPGWSGERVREASEAIVIGTGSAQGYVTTPVLGAAGDATLTFRAGAWNGGSEQTTLRIEITGGGTLSEETVTMAKGAFTAYTINITGATEATQITFRGFQASNSRFFLDDVVVTAGSQTVTDILNQNVGNVTSYEVTGLDSESTYYYVVRGVAGAETTANSNEITVVTAEPTPAIIWENGAWTSTPTATDDVIIRDVLFVGSDYPSFEVNNLTVQFGTGAILIEAGSSITVNGIIDNENNASDFIVEDGASLIQIVDVPNYGEITVLKSSTPMKRSDNTLWSSPVAAQSIRAFSPETLWNRFWTYNESTDAFAQLFTSQSADADFTAGQGVAIRIGYDPNFGENETRIFDGEFIGVPFNGTQTVTLTNSLNGYNIVGNPYASNVRIGGANSFLSNNTNVNALYFWTHDGSGTYAAVTRLGSTNDADSSQNISVGQGFIVGAPTGGVVTFNNAMRVDGTAPFYKGTQEDMNRIWLSLSDNEVKFNQILVGYLNGATNGVDAQIDGALLENSTSEIYSLIDADKFAIQGRASFEKSDVVALGLKTENAGSFTIALQNMDGLFSEGQIVYLKDNDLEITHNLNESAYAFRSEAGVFNERFEIVYESDETMGNDELTSNSVQVYTQDNNIVVSSKSEKILSVELYDMNARSIHRDEKVNSNLYQISAASKGVLVIKVLTQNGKVVTKKVINK